MGWTQKQVKATELLAEQLLKARDFTYAACETLVRALPMRRPEMLRQAHKSTGVLERDLATPGTLVLGLFAHGPMCGMTRGTDQCSLATRYFNLFMRDKLPPGELHQWSSLSVSRNVPSKPHMDAHNVAQSMNLSVSMGRFSGGELWLEIPSHEVAKHRKVEWRVKGNGIQVPGRLINTRHKLVAFGPKTTHATQPWQGFRISITAYLSRAALRVRAHILQQLRDLHFPISALGTQPASDPSEALLAAKDEPSSSWKLSSTGPATNASAGQSGSLSMSGGVDSFSNTQTAIGNTLPGPPMLDQAHDHAHSQCAPVAIVLEDHPAVSLLLQQHGFFVEHLQPAHVNSTATATLSRRIKEGTVMFVWFDLPIPGRQVAKPRLTAYVAQLCIWLQHCAEQHIPGSVFGGFRKSMATCGVDGPPSVPHFG